MAVKCTFDFGVEQFVVLWEYYDTIAIESASIIVVVVVVAIALFKIADNRF